MQPLHYDIAMTLDAKSASFSARVAIDLEVTAPTNGITLHAADLKFTSATLTPKTGAAQGAHIAVNKAAQTASFRFAKPLARGRYKLAVDYTGTIGSQAVGLFLLDYETSEGKRRALFTQFENSDARRMIPSWDEPAFKATFALRATVPAGEMAVSNMPVKSIDQIGMLADTWALGLAGLQPASNFLDLAQATPLTADPQVWTRIADGR